MIAIEKFLLRGSGVAIWRGSAGASSRPTAFCVMRMHGIDIGVTLALALAFRLGAQEVRGRAFAPGSTTPVAGVIATLVDPAGVVVDRMLTTETGSYRLRAPRAGIYRVRALRIGFRPTQSPELTLGAGQVLEHSIELGALPFMLAAVQVEGERACRIRPDSGSQAFAAWEEARKALDAALLTRDRRYLMELVLHERRTSAQTGRVQFEEERESRATTSRPFVSVSAAQLDSGYVVHESGWTTFRAPDEEVLLSERFAATHCLKLGDPVADDEVSVAFEPVGDRTATDIRGTLVLDRATGMLRRLEFTFVNVAREVQQENAGGRVDFRHLPSGGWIVDRWTMRFPLFERAVVQQPGRTGDLSTGNLRLVETLRLSAMQETGGEVVEVTQGDTIVWQVERPRLAGVVRDEHGTPIGGATVTIPTLGRRAVTDETGHFAMAAVRRGRRQLVVTTPLLDSLALAPISRDADSRSTDEVMLTIPDRDASFATACRRSPAETRQIGFLRGATRGPHGERVAGVRIVVAWFQPVGTTFDPRAPGGIRTLETVSDAAGDYAFCGVRVDQQLTIRLWVAGAPAGEVKTRVPPESRLLLVDLPVHATAATSP